MEEINGILIFTMASLLFAYKLGPAGPRWLQRLVGLVAIGAAASLLIWEVRVPMAAWLHSALVYGSALLCIAVGLWMLVRGDPEPEPPPQ